MIPTADLNAVGTFSYGPARIESTAPAAYRLIKKKTGELVLQGCFVWWRGKESGQEWRDIPTEIEQ